MRLLWTGTLEHGGTVEIPGLSNYSMLVFRTSRSAATLPATRQATPAGEWSGGMTASTIWPGDAGGLYLQAVQTASEGDTLELVRAVGYYINTNGQVSQQSINDTLNAVWGVV